MNPNTNGRGRPPCAPTEIAFDPLQESTPLTWKLASNNGDVRSTCGRFEVRVGIMGFWARDYLYPIDAGEPRGPVLTSPYYGCRAEAERWCETRVSVVPTVTLYEPPVDPVGQLAQSVVAEQVQWTYPEPPSTSVCNRFYLFQNSASKPGDPRFVVYDMAAAESAAGPRLEAFRFSQPLPLNEAYAWANERAGQVFAQINGEWVLVPNDRVNTGE